MTIFLLLLSGCWAESPSQKLDSTKKSVEQTHQESKNSQNKINQWDDETRQALQEYKNTLKKTETLKIYNQQLSNYIQLQKEEMLDIRKKIEQVKNTGKEIEPLMIRMLESLENFIHLDVPFLLSKRQKRIQELKKALNRADVSVSEKYRQLMSAYKLELEYGKTLQSYKKIKKIEGKEITVDYLRLGRIVLIYKSLDGSLMGYWNQKQRKWEKLPRSYKKSVSKAIKMAKKQVPPDLIRLPVPQALNNEQKTNSDHDKI